MKILFHTHEFNINEGGPCTKRIDSLAEHLEKQGHKVIVLTSSHNKMNEKNIERKYKIIYSYSTKKIKGNNLQRFLNNIIFGITSLFKSFTIGKIDLVVTTSPPPFISIFGYYIAKIKRAKLVYDVRDIWPDVAIEMESFKENSIYYKIFKFIADFMYKKSDYITTVTPGKLKKIKSYVYDKQKIKYIPNGLDDNFYQFEVDNNIVKKYDLEQIFTIVYIGNIGLAQNLDSLIELAQNFVNKKNIQFLIFGDGAYKNKLVEKIRSLNLTNIKFEGKIDYCKVHTVLKYAKISFISLKNNKMTDSVPTKMFDALGIGCPVLLLAKGDSCEILEKTNLGEHTENSQNLKSKLEFMINNYEKYDNNKKYAIQYIRENYSRKKIAEKFERELIYVK